MQLVPGIFSHSKSCRRAGLHLYAASAPLPFILAEIMLFLQFFAKKFVLFTLVFCRNCAIMEFIT